MSLAGDGQTSEVVLERAPDDFSILHGDRIVFVDRASPELPGPLVVHVPDEGVTTIDDAVLDILWPLESTSIDRAFPDAAEILYAVDRGFVPEVGGPMIVRRTVLP